MMFDNNDFGEINFLNFDNDFKIELDNSSKIIFGFNGIGKSTIYKHIKSKHFDYDYIDYEETKDSFLKKKKEIEIGANLQTIDTLNNDITLLNQANDVEGCLKKYGYSSQAKAKTVSEEFAIIQNKKEIDRITIDDSKIKLASMTLYENIKKVFFDNYQEIRKMADLKNEMEKLQNVYMNQAYEALFNSIADNETTCPACNTKGIHNLKEIFTQKRKAYEAKEKSIFGQFHFKEGINKEEQIEKLIQLAKSLNGREIAEIIICDVNPENRNMIIANLKEIDNKKAQIETLKEKLKNYYNNIKKEENEIKQYFEDKFDIKEMYFDDENFKIIIRLNRGIDSYSEGEIHLIILLLKLYEFRINDKEIMIMDDPLTSYDLINQYKTLFEIVNTVRKEKRILMFTHNIEVINIINSQNPSAFKYQYIEKCSKKLFLDDIDIFETGSILSLKNLLKYDSKGYLKLLIEREKSGNGDYSKVFHYDEPYTIQNGEFGGLTNDDLVKLIDDFDSSIISRESFSHNSYNKIIYMCAIRVWMEKKFYNIFEGNTEMLQKMNDKEFSEKVGILLPKDSDSLISDIYPNVTRTFLMSKKVMLNQNDHYQSQIIPFHYALNISLDDLCEEIMEIKERFKN